MAVARENVAVSLGPRTDPEQLVFTSSGSEANQLAIRSVLESLERPHWITTPVEHDSVRQLLPWLQARGGSVSELAVDSEGLPIPSSIEAVWRPETALVSAIWVGNETGAVTDIAALAGHCRERGVPLHLDAAQAWGKLPIDVEAIGAAMLTLSSHKIGAPAGTGVLWLKRGNKAQAIIPGKQEKGRRGGTENLLGIVATGTAAKALNPAAWAARVTPVRDRLEAEILKRIPGSTVNGGRASRVANTSNFNFEGVEGDGMVMALDLAGYSVSAGSACSSGVIEPSHVLRAMGRSPKQAMAAIRVSLADAVPWDDLEGFVGALEAIVPRMRAAV
jgi:cysteine desulfurase